MTDWTFAAARRTASLVLVLSMLLAGCSGGGSIPSDIAAQFDTAGERVANVAGSVGVDESAIADAIARADALGVPLRVVVVDGDRALVGAADVVSAYGGTALSYSTGDLGFEADSKQLAKEQRDRAVAAAAEQGSIAGSVAAFVAQLESEGVQESGSGNGLAVLLLLLAAALFLIWQLFRLFSARRRRDRREAELEQRRKSLYNWAGDLAPEISVLSGPVSMRGSHLQQEQLSKARVLGQQIQGTLPQARLDDLDAAEIRLARAFMQLRDMRKALGV